MEAKITGRGIVYRNNLEEKRYNAWPTAAKTDDGRIAVVFSGNRATHICPFGKDLMCVSDAKNINFDNSCRVLVDTPLDARDPGILNMGGGRLMLTWFSLPVESYEVGRRDDIIRLAGDNEKLKAEILAKIDEYKFYPPELRRGGSFYKLSDDNGNTWSEQLSVPVSTPHGPVMLADGTVFYLGKSMFGGEFMGRLVPYLSHDFGKTWEPGGAIPFPDGIGPGNFHEAHAAELPDGTIIAVIRTEKITSELYPIKALTMFKSFSKDKGKTWTVPEYMGINGAPPHLLVHSSGALVCAYSRREAQTGIKAIVSYDGGKSWSCDFFISNIPIKGTDLGYPASIELDDGRIFTVFYQRYADDNRTSICYSIWQIEK